VAIEITRSGLQKPDGNELVRGGDNIISFNAQKTQELIDAAQDQGNALADRLGVAEAALNAGAGGPGLSADPDHPGLYYFAGPTIAPDPLNPGLFTF
jgi:hypothetical protein